MFRECSTYLALLSISVLSTLIESTKLYIYLGFRYLSSFLGFQKVRTLSEYTNFKSILRNRSISWAP